MGNCVRNRARSNLPRRQLRGSGRVRSLRGQLREGGRDRIFRVGNCAGASAFDPCAGNCARAGAIESSARETVRERVSSNLRAGNREKRRARVELEVEGSGRETNRRLTASTRGRIIARATAKWIDFERLRTESSRGQPGGGAVRRRRLREGRPLGNWRRAERGESRPKSTGG